MPEYLAPGVYVEEVSFRSKSIEGVSTTTTGFIGPARYGPLDLEPDVITSLAEFERTYGDRQQLQFMSVADGGAPAPMDPMHNYLWHAVRAFFEEGGKRLYIVRTFRPIGRTSDGRDDDGRAGAWLPRPPAAPADRAGAIRIQARFPGSAGSMRVRLTLRLGQNILSSAAGSRTVGGLRDRDLVWLSNLPSPVPSPAPAASGDLYIAESYFNATTNEDTWRFVGPLAAGGAGSPPAPLELTALDANVDPVQSDKVRIVTLTVTVIPLNGTDLPAVWPDLALDPGHLRDAEPDSVFDRFAQRPSNLGQARTLPIIMSAGDDLTDGLRVLRVLLDANPGLRDALNNPASTDADRSVEVVLTGGNDGQRPTASEYEGTADENQPFKTGLMALEDIEDISIIAAPGATYGFENGYRADATTINNLLISHAERMRYRVAVLDSGNGQTIAQVRSMRAKMDSKYAALYYPWVRILDPVTRREIHVPPSGAMAGIYARNDINRAVFKAPANEVVNTAIGFELLLNKSQQEVLNPEGINCLRFFEGRGFRVWGARTISSDPEWKYLNLRRYFAYLERSIDRGTQWAVFEPNGEALWTNVRLTIQDFLFNEWFMGALLGDKPEKAYFVRCDRSTMTQNDLDNGRLVCLIGVAALRPAEFVIFRIGQWTADRKG